ncbi:MAG: DUF3817 domain-containing protein [Flavobacterium sp.]|nr:DUF3817 domain-containing protein [Flavobacterium sp.]
MTRLFKTIAFLEGTSLLLLLFIAMPLKYIGNDPTAVKYVGMAHGVLFVVYILMAIMMKIEYSWSWKKFFVVCLASMVPFGTFYTDKKYFRASAV